MRDMTAYWYKKYLHPSLILLLPFSWCFRACTALRRQLYNMGLLKTRRFSAPVIVVGNISVGGTGKTPFVIWLANLLREQGYRPGIVSRGVGGKKQTKPHLVQKNDKAVEVGDEALLLIEETQSPVVICRDRAAAVDYLLQHALCDIVISDDGLQHYRLGRQIEIAMVDGVRRFGNAHVLPAGPLRETIARLKKVDFVVVTEGGADDQFVMQVIANEFVSLHTKQVIPLADFPRQPIQAVAGIGHPERFFSALKCAGFNIDEHRFPDHHLFQASDMPATAKTIVMTQKDAVKCRVFADERYWYLKITVKMTPVFIQQLLQKIKSLEINHDSETDFGKRTCATEPCIQSSSFGTDNATSS